LILHDLTAICEHREKDMPTKGPVLFTRAKKGRSRKEKRPFRF
jgi:hypothetical protein